ncbi:MAG: cytochrome ubiquinol oxidase subunit I [Deltaproteobacteria bacterium]|nr:cytochrome ubiquinol oxidase subunit I [Deltaproteobacteria bacterium]
MQFPHFFVPRAGGGLLIAAVAIFHIMIAHFAVGTGLFNAVSETVARRRGDTALREFLRTHTRFLILLSFVAGAVSGVGIWLTTAIVSPSAISTLIHQFMWGWATEWVFFIVEIAAGYVYYYGWDRLDPRTHEIVGWIYAASAWLSLFVINGILTFMLTPGAWLSEHDFWLGFFNPTMLPSLLIRTVSCVSLAAIFAVIIASVDKKLDRDERGRIVRYAGLWLMSMVLMLPLSLWYFVMVPAKSRDLVFGGAVPMTMFFVFGLIASTILGLYAWFGVVRRSHDVNLPTALTMLAVSAIATGSLEFVREGIRKPFVISGYMYSNSILKTDVPELNRTGILAKARWVVPQGADPRTATPQDRGRWVFDAECAQCHTMDGFNAMRPLVKGWSRPLIDMSLSRLDEMKYFMPPFVGSDAERRDLGVYLDMLDGVENVPPRPESPPQKEPPQRRRQP